MGHPVRNPAYGATPSDPLDQSHTPALTSKAPGASLLPVIRLLNKDNMTSINNMKIQNKNWPWSRKASCSFRWVALIRGQVEDRPGKVHPAQESPWTSGFSLSQHCNGGNSLYVHTDRYQSILHDVLQILVGEHHSFWRPSGPWCVHDYGGALRGRRDTVVLVAWSQTVSSLEE